MLIEVHTTGKPAVQGRAMLAAVALLLGTGALAGHMTWHRATHPLGQRISPPGWGLSFQVPRSFSSPPPQVWIPRGTRHFVGPTGQGTAATLAVMLVDDAPADTDCAIASWAVGADGHTTPAAACNTERLGSLDGAELLAPQATRIARVAAVSQGRALVVLLDVSPTTIDDPMYRLFDLTCRSIRLTP